MKQEGYTERLLPILVHIQTHLDENLSLEEMAGQVDLSPFHFHRIFHQAIGETLKQYTQRLRLERAAYHLRICQENILDIALSAGFHNHETFSRAFRKRFGTTPQQFRHSYSAVSTTPLNSRESLNQFAAHYQLSKTAVQRLNPIPVAFIRHLGPYVDVEVNHFATLIGWAQMKGLYRGDNLLMGVGHDDPHITPADKVRFDACLEVSHPVQSEGVIGFQELPGGYYAVTTYIGPYGRILEASYFAIFQQVSQLKQVRVIGLPVVEIYRTTHINPDYDLNQTDICIPVEIQLT